MKNYKDMTTEEIKEQLEWSDQHEFSYGYSMWAFEEIERLNNIINELEKYLNEQTQKSWEIEEQCYEDIESKLQELKGSNLAIPPEVIGTNGEDGGLFDYGDK